MRYVRFSRGELCNAVGGVQGKWRRAAENHPFIIRLGVPERDLRDSVIVLTKIQDCLFSVAENKFTCTL